jgi:hypothetical protein
MNPRIELDDTVAAAIEVKTAKVDPPPPINQPLAHANWETSTNDGLNLYLSDEPGIGDEFSYNGVRWQIIDYRDGWVARLLV